MTLSGEIVVSKGCSAISVVNNVSSYLRELGARVEMKDQSTILINIGFVSKLNPLYALSSGEISVIDSSESSVTVRFVFGDAKHYAFLGVFGVAAILLLIAFGTPLLPVLLFGGVLLGIGFLFDLFISRPLKLRRLKRLISECL